MESKKSNLQIVYSIDTVGLFLYDLKTRVGKKIYTTDNISFDKEMEFLNDSIILIGFQNKSKKEDKRRIRYSEYIYNSVGDSSFVTYTDIENHLILSATYYALNINNGFNYIFKIIDYDYYFPTLKFKTTFYDINGQITTAYDSTIYCNYVNYTKKGIRFIYDSRNGYSKSNIVKGTHIFSKQGDLFLTNEIDTTLLLKHYGEFESKYRTGYCNPVISPDGKKFCFQYRYVYRFGEIGVNNYEMNLETNKIRKLVGNGFFNPIYSSDGNKILISKRCEIKKTSNSVNTIYVLDSKSKRKMKVGIGSEYVWRPN